MCQDPLRYRITLCWLEGCSDTPTPCSSTGKLQAPTIPNSLGRMASTSPLREHKPMLTSSPPTWEIQSIRRRHQVRKREFPGAKADHLENALGPLHGASFPNAQVRPFLFTH